MRFQQKFAGLIAGPRIQDTAKPVLKKTLPAMNKTLIALTTAVTATLVVSCSSSSNYQFDRAAASYDPAGGTLPFPNGLLFAGSEDGTLNIPVADPANFGDPTVALNAQDGFSTTEAATAPFSQILDPASVTLGESVRIFEVEADPQTMTPLSVVRELDATEALATPAGDGSTLAVVPLRPLKESTHYMVLITEGVKDAENGNNIGRSGLFNIVADQGDLLDPEGATAPLIPLSQLTNQLLSLGASQGVNRDSVIMAWNFKTQSITPVLQAAKDQASAANIAVVPSGLNTGAVLPGSPGVADIFVGTLDLPYYLQTPTAENPTAPLTGFWTGQMGSNLTAFNPVPEVKSTQTVPVLMTAPNANAGVGEQPAEGWPIVVFQHGITRNRTDMLAIADTMAAAGFAVIAIDLPMHGITDSSSPLYAAGAERTFDLDFQGADGSQGPDGAIDSSGAYFYNLQNLLNTRDNFRQAIADLWVLSASVANLGNVNASQKAFVGLSLGAIVGSTMLAFDSSFTSATLASGGGGTARLLAASPTFGGEIVAGLSAAGIDIASADGQAFLSATQTLVDSADPVNHAAATAANTPIHLTQMLPDQVVLGTVEGAALSGTEPLARLMGLPVVSQTSSGSGWVRFLGGVHGSLLDPSADAGVTQELQTQTAKFAASAGQLLEINNPDLLEPAP